MLVLTACAGGLGAICRYLIDFYVSQYVKAHFFGIFLANCVGSAIAGGVLAAHQHGAAAQGSYIVLALGFCGGFTTFSTAMVHLVQHAWARNWWRAMWIASWTALACIATATSVHLIVSWLIAH